MSEKMKAVVVRENGVQIASVDRPQPKPSQLMIKVRSCSVNRSDLLTVQGQNFGHVGGGSEKVMGASFCGEVVEAGAECKGFSPGDRVMGVGAAGWAEYALSDWRTTLPFPSDEMDYIQAGSLLSAVATMHDAIVTNGEFKAGQSILIQGASSGVGIMGLQIGKFLGAKLVFGTSTNPERRDKLKDFGADFSLDSNDETWVDHVLEATDGEGVNLIIDNVSGSTTNQNLRATALNGRIINVGRLGGLNADFNSDLHAERRIIYIGTTGRTRSQAEKIEVIRLAKNDLWEAVGQGKLTMPIDSTFHFSDASSALERMAENKHFGRIMLEVS